jgi:hypothetical protein
MTNQPELRVSDRDRQAAADRLRAAHDEGRLDLDEYDNRLARAYSSVTYGDLDRLFVDLPGAVAQAPQSRTPAIPAPALRPRDVPAAAAGLPMALKVLWTIWGAVVGINLTVWLLVSLGNEDAVYFWPMWLLVPGSVLFVTSAATMAHRAGRRSSGPSE